MSTRPCTSSQTTKIRQEKTETADASAPVATMDSEISLPSHFVKLHSERRQERSQMQQRWQVAVCGSLGMTCDTQIHEHPPTSKPPVATPLDLVDSLSEYANDADGTDIGGPSERREESRRPRSQCNVEPLTGIEWDCRLKQKLSNFTSHRRAAVAVSLLASLPESLIDIAIQQAKSVHASRVVQRQEHLDRQESHSKALADSVFLGSEDISEYPSDSDGGGESERLSREFGRISSCEQFSQSDELDAIQIPYPYSNNHMEFRFHAKGLLNIFIVKRLGSKEVTQQASRIIRRLLELGNVRVVVEPSCLSEFKKAGLNVSTWRSSWTAQKVVRQIDLVVALGGDGTILWVSHLFPETVPPVLTVGMGSLGYLTRFSVDKVAPMLSSLFLGQSFQVNLRSRLNAVALNECNEVIPGSFCTAFNEMAISSARAAVATLDVYANNHFFTTVSADGLIIATPTGSTAYSMSSGGSMVHPEVPAMLFTPICPHSLSVRPLVLPETVILKILHPSDNRCEIFLSVDGKQAFEIKKNSACVLWISPYPFPMIASTHNDALDPWLNSLKTNLNWNFRIRQKHLDD